MLETCLKREGEIFEGFASDRTRTVSSIGFGAVISHMRHLAVKCPPAHQLLLY